MGPVEIRYDPDRLAAVDAELTLPPDWERRVSGIKLIAAEREHLLGQERCMYGQAGMALPCVAESEAGLAFAVLEQPYAELRDSLPSGRREPATLAGRDGVAWKSGVEGESSVNTFVPLDGERTLLVERRIRNSGNPDEAAVNAVLDRLRLDG